MLGYILGFMVSFLLLITVLYGFGIVATEGSRLTAEAEMKDIANRVANGVLETFALASMIHGTNGTVDSANETRFLYSKTFLIPPEARGYSYRIELSPAAVFVNSTNGLIRANSTTFKADVVVAPAGTCTSAYKVCEMSGSVGAGSSRVVVTYEFKPPHITPPAGLVNRIRIG